MSRLQPRLQDDPSRDDVAYLDERLYEFNVERTGHADGRELAIWLRDDAGAIAGGLYGWTWGGWLEVRTLWLREDLRGQGYGRELVEQAEAEALARGCHAAFLASYSFQAPGMYKKLGYREFATLDEFPLGQQNHFFVKELVGGKAPAT